MNEPSDTTPDPSDVDREAECENCGEILNPAEWITDDESAEDGSIAEVNEPTEDTGYQSSHRFCDEVCLEEWKTEQ